MLQLDNAIRRMLVERARILDNKKDVASTTPSLAIISENAFNNVSPAIFQAFQDLSSRGIPTWLISKVIPNTTLGGIQFIQVQSDHIRDHLPPADIFLTFTWHDAINLYHEGISFILVINGSQFHQLPCNQDALADLCLLPAAIAVYGSFEDQMAMGMNRIIIRISDVPDVTEQTRSIEQHLGVWSALKRYDPLWLEKPKISLCMIVKNESTHITEAIRSAYGAVDEVCVVDTGSTDNTIELALKSGARVNTFEWCDDFSAARNAALQMASGDWILQLDADERLTPKACALIRQLVLSRSIDGYNLPIDSPTPLGWSYAYVLRLFRNRPWVKYSGIIHEAVGTSIIANNGKLGTAQAHILHLGYTSEMVLQRGKRNRNRVLLERALKDEPNNGTYIYYLSVEDYVSDDPESALNRLSTFRKPTHRAWLKGEPIILEGRCHYRMGNWRAAFQCASYGAEEWPHVLWFQHVKAELGYALNIIDQSRSAIQHLQAWKDTYVGDPSFAYAIGTFVAGCMADNDSDAIRLWTTSCKINTSALRPLLRRLIRTRGIKSTLEEAVRLSIVPDTLWPKLIQALIDLQRTDDAVMLIDTVSESKKLCQVGDVYMQLGDFEQSLGIWRASGHEGWLRYGLVAALFGTKKDLAECVDHVTPFELSALTDLQNKQDSWRPAALVPIAVDMGNVDIIKRLSAYRIDLAESIAAYYRLYVQP